LVEIAVAALPAHQAISVVVTAAADIEAITARRATDRFAGVVYDLIMSKTVVRYARK
jgi:hypothetical protein